MKNINQINIDNKRVLIRVDYNVPINNGKIVDSFRIDASFETIRYCLARNCKVVLMSHLGRPKGYDLELSLRVVYDYLKKKLPYKIFFSNDCTSEEAINISLKMKNKEIHLLENLRFHEQESLNDSVFSEKLSKHAEVYINDAFGTAHRAHASNSGITNYFNQKCHGFLINKEKKYLKENINNNQQSISLLLGGAKISDKIKLIKRFVNIADDILIGGAMANNFLIANGFNIGKSLYEKDCVEFAREMINNQYKAKLHFPVDVTCTENIEKKENIRVLNAKEVKDNDYIVDIGSETIADYKRIISKSTCVIWNGPMGIIEIPEYLKGTNAILKSVKDITEKGSLSIIGGGDTSTIIKKEEMSNFTHISTGGGACLKLLSGESMPAFEALS